MRNGNNSFGGGAVATFGTASLTVKDGTVFDNNAALAGAGAARGGAIWLQSSGNISIDDATFTNNTATTSGGAISTRDLNYHDNVVISNSTFENNSSANGGAILVGFNDTGYSMTLAGTNTFTGNTATSGGGAIALDSQSNSRIKTLKIAEDATVIFTGNSAANGGAIHVRNSNQIVTDGKMIFYNNTATNGGAICYNDGANTATTHSYISNAEFIGNTATNGGAIFGNVIGTLELDQCTIVENSSGIYFSPKAKPTVTVMVSNSVVGWNTDYDVYFTNTPTTAPVTDNNLIGTTVKLTVPEDQQIGDLALSDVYAKNTSDAGIPVYSAYSHGAGVYTGDDGQKYAYGANPELVLDIIPPEIAGIVRDGNEGWNTADVALTITASDNDTAADNLRYAITESSAAPAADAEIWQKDNTFTFNHAGTAVFYFWVKDEAGNISAEFPAQTVMIDQIAPVLGEKAFETIVKQNVTIRWDEATDEGGSGIAGYRIRLGTSADLTGDGELVPSRSVSYQMSNGTYFYQTGAADGAGNITWSDVKKFVIAMNPGLSADAEIVSGPGGSNGVEWQTNTDEAASYVVEYSTDNFASVIRIETDAAGLATMNLPGGDWQWRVQYAGSDEWIAGNQEIKVDQPETAAAGKYTAVQDGKQDVFFVRSSGTWQNGFQARHVGSKKSGWSGTNETTHIMGQNQFGDIFAGCEDASILYMTDDANGDALFVDDVFSESLDDAAKTQSRLANIDEIRAGAGNDIVDMTSQKFDYTGDGLTIRGGAGDDTLWANSGDNFLFGDAGSDRIVGADGSDVIVGGTGNDRMHGGGGDDTFTFGGNWGNDIIEQLDGGTVTLWFENGVEESELTVEQNGSNTKIRAEYGSITVVNTAPDGIILKFGSDDTGLYAELADLGAFSGTSTEKIFETNPAIAAL